MNVGAFIVTDSGIERVISTQDYGGYTAEIVLTKEAFVQCYKKWIEESEKADETCDLAEIGKLNPGTTIEAGGIQMEILDIAYPVEGGGLGILCLAKDVLFNMAFDESDCNNWAQSSLRKYLNGEYKEKLIDALGDDGYLLAMQRDLTTDDGLKDYGRCMDYISLISCDEYRKYREHISNKSDWWWTLTAYSVPFSGYSYSTRFVCGDGSLNRGYAYYGDCGVAPVFLLLHSLKVRMIEQKNREVKDDD